MTIPLLILATTLMQAPDPQVQMSLDQSSYFAGGYVTGKVMITFADGFHAYQNPPSKDYQIPVVLDSDGSALAFVNYPAGKSMVIGGEVEPSLSYSGATVIPFIVKLSDKPGKQTIALSISYQQCNDQACFPPGRQALSQEIEVSPTTATSWARSLGLRVGALAKAKVN